MVKQTGIITRGTVNYEISDTRRSMLRTTEGKTIL